MKTLNQYLAIEHYNALSFVFPKLNLENIKVKFVEKDGKSGFLAFISSTFFKPTTTIKLDKADWEENRLIDPFHSYEGLILCHELIHCEQTLSFWNRVIMRLANFFIEYEDRWHEKEAHTNAPILLEKWKGLING